MFHRALPGIAAAVLLASTARAESAEDVVAKYLAAHGGIQKIKSVQTLRMSGKMIMGHGGEAPYTRFSKRPNRMRTEFRVQGMTGIQAFDGRDAWALLPFMGQTTPQVAPAEESRRMAEQADLDGALVDWKEKGHTIELAGKEPVEGADAWKLKVTLKGGEVRNYFVDVETGLIVKVSGKSAMRGSEVDFETLMGDYREVEGHMMPFAVETGITGMPTRQKAVIDSIAFNVDLPDSLFAVPATAVRAPATPDTTKAAPPAPGAPKAEPKPDRTKSGAGSRG